jgi:hypothetical protein
VTQPFGGLFSLVKGTSNVAVGRNALTPPANNITAVGYNALLLNSNNNVVTTTAEHIRWGKDVPSQSPFSEPLVNSDKLQEIWAKIASLLSFRELPGHPSALEFAKRFNLIVCGGIVWRVLRGDPNRAPDVDFIAPSQRDLDAAIATVAGSYSVTKLGGARMTWKLKSTDYNGVQLEEHIDVMLAEPPKLISFVGGFPQGKRVMWSPSGLFFDLDIVAGGRSDDPILLKACQEHKKTY